MVRSAAGEFELLSVPGLFGAQLVFLDQFLGLGDQLAGGNNRVDQTVAVRRSRIPLLALKQEWRGIHHTNKAWQTLGATTAGQNADHGFRQAELGLGIVVRHDPVMTGQSDLETAAQGEAVNGRRDRLAAGFQRPECFIELEAFLEQSRLGLVLRKLGQIAHRSAQFGQISTRTECALAGGDNRALDRVIRSNFVGDVRKFTDHFARQDIHRLARNVEGEGGDTIAVQVVIEIFHCSNLLLDPKPAR